MEMCEKDIKVLQEFKLMADRTTARLANLGILTEGENIITKCEEIVDVLHLDMSGSYLITLIDLLVIKIYSSDHELKRLGLLGLTKCAVEMYERVDKS